MLRFCRHFSFTAGSLHEKVRVDGRRVMRRTDAWISIGTYYVCDRIPLSSELQSCRSSVKTHLNCVAVLVSEALVLMMSLVSPLLLVVTRNVLQWKVQSRIL